MKNFPYNFSVALLGILWITGVPAVAADGEARPGDVKSPSQSPPTQRRFAAAFDDPAFDRYVNIALLGKAWCELDSKLLADVALQLKEGERVLHRPHQAVKADSVLSLAIKLAQANRDQETLNRLSKALKNPGKKNLVAQVTAARMALDHPAGKERGPLMTVGQWTPQQFIEHHSHLQRLRAARVLGDRSELKALSASITDSDLPLPAKEHLSKLTAEALRGASEHASSGRLVALLNHFAVRCAAEKQQMEAAMRSYNFFKAEYASATARLNSLQQQSTAAWNRYTRLKREGKHREAAAAKAEFDRLGPLISAANSRRNYASRRQSYWWGEFLSRQTAYRNCVSRNR